MGEPFGFDARFDVSDACSMFEDILNEVHDLAKTPLERSRDVFMYKESPSLNYDIYVPNPLDHFDTSPLC